MTSQRPDYPDSNRYYPERYRNHRVGSSWAGSLGGSGVQ